jgi:hypothetical protein
MSGRTALSAALAICAAFFVGILAFVSMDPDLLGHGEAHTDERAIIAAQQFRRVGIVALHFLQTEDGGAEIGLEPAWYARHPGFGAIVLALGQEAGLSLHAARAVPLLATTVGVFCVFLFFRLATRNAWMGVLAAAVYATLSPVWLLADAYLFHSWPLTAKAATLWLVAAGCQATGARRWRRFGGAGIVAALGIALCGLETMPSTGFLAFLLPFALLDDRASSRFATALQSAGSVGLGMVAGLGLRLWNMSQAFGGDFGDALDRFAQQTRFRSSFGIDVVHVHGSDYAADILRRIWVYTPHVIVLLAVGLLAAIARRVWNDPERPRPTRRWAPRLIVAAVLGEGIYFVAMRNHVAEHYHTLILLTLAMTTLATWGLTALGELVPRAWPRWFRGVAAGVVLAAAVLVAPLESGGNLRAPGTPSGGRMMRTEVASYAALLPPRSVVITAAGGSAYFDFAVELVMKDHSVVVLSGALKDREATRVVAQAVASGRPTFGMVDRRLRPEILSVVGSVGRPVAAGPLTVLYGFANYDPRALPAVRTTMADDVLKETVFTAPTPKDLAAAGIRHPVYGTTDRGIWMTVPQADIPTPATVGVVPFRTDPGFTEIAVATADFAYPVNPEVAQPAVVVGFRVRSAPGGTASGDLAIEKTAKPGEIVECRVSVPEGVTVADFEVWARRPDGESSNTGASVVCSAIRLEHR